MNKDDTIYISLLVTSVPIGFIFKNYVRSAKQRAYISSAIGFLMALIVCSYDIYHSFLLTLVNSVLLVAINPRFALLSPFYPRLNSNLPFLLPFIYRYVPIFSFLWCFGYLLFFRLTHLFGLPKPIAYANAVQLILTLKVIHL